MSKEDRKFQKRLKVEEEQRLRARLEGPEFDHLRKRTVSRVMGFIFLIVLFLYSIWWLIALGYFSP